MPMHRIASTTVVIGFLVAACGSTSPSGSPTQPSSAPPASSAGAVASPVASGGTLELPSAGSAVPPGTYTRTGFRPPVTLTVGDGWVVGTAGDGFFDVQQDRGSPDVIAVQFARVLGVVSAAASPAAVTSAADAVRAIHANPALTVVDESASRLGGLDGLNVVVENRGTATAGVMDVAPGRLSFDPGRKLWISFFDTADGVVAVLVGGSIAQWDAALAAAEPVLESIAIGGAPSPSPS